MPSIAPSLNPLQQLIYHKGIEKLRQKFYEAYNHAEVDQTEHLYELVDFEADIIHFWDISTPNPFIRKHHFSFLLEHVLDEAIPSASLYISLRLENLASEQLDLEAKKLRGLLQQMLLESMEHPVISKYPLVTTAIEKLIREVNSYATDLGVLTITVSTPMGNVGSKIIAPSFIYVDPKEVNGKGNSGQAMTKAALGDILASLKGEHLISPATRAPDFYRIFSGKPVITRVKWLGTSAELHAFVDAIEVKLGKPRTGKVMNKWEVAIRCFENLNGESYTARQLTKHGTPREKMDYLGKRFQAYASLLK